MFRPAAVPSIEQSKLDEARQTYRELCKRFVAEHPNHEFHAYIESSIITHAALDRHIRALELYAPYVKPTMKVLDWGCRQAPDSCMLRSLHPQMDLSGCDFPEDDFSIFHEYAQLRFQRLKHEYELPYPDRSFDAVISSGVLEHVAFEHESLREIWRILREEGLLFVTFLPNATSVSENVARLLGSFGGHTRLYNLSETQRMFLRSGFAVEKCGFHQVFPTFAYEFIGGKVFIGGKALRRAADLGAGLNRRLERVPLVNRVASNLFFILRRVEHF